MQKNYKYFYNARKRESNAAHNHFNLDLAHEEYKVRYRNQRQLNARQRQSYAWTAATHRGQDHTTRKSFRGCWTCSHPHTNTFNRIRTSFVYQTLTNRQTDRHTQRANGHKFGANLDGKSHSINDWSNYWNESRSCMHNAAHTIVHAQINVFVCVCVCAQLLPIRASQSCSHSCDV